MNLIAYRAPREERVVIYKLGQSQRIDFNDDRLRFVVSPFDHTKNGFQYPVLDGITEIPSNILELNNKEFFFQESTKEKYGDYIATIKDYLKEDKFKKVVASRRYRHSAKVNVNNLFDILCDKYPDAFVFFVSTEEFGSWIGASPELLLEKKREKITSMSLAGTRSEGHTDEWDDKNILEQKIVTDYIISLFKTHGLMPHITSQGTRKAGNVEHLYSTIECEFQSGIDMNDLLHQLSPTPALSGYPKNEAIDIINRFETPRILYGGYLGPIYADGDFKFNVILRCAYLQPDTVTLFAGGGITNMSDPDLEWTETEKKLDTIRSLL